MIGKSLLLKKEYDKYYNSLLKSGNLPMRDTKLGFWGCAAFDDVLDIFDKINLKKFKKFLDLGSGDGKVVLLASLFGVKATGVEIDKELVNKSETIRDKFKLEAEFINKDFNELNLKKYGVIFYNPDKPFNLWLEDKINEEFIGLFVVYNNIFLPRSFKKKEEFWINRTCISVYDI